MRAGGVIRRSQQVLKHILIGSGIGSPLGESDATENDLMKTVCGFTFCFSLMMSTASVAQPVGQANPAESSDEVVLNFRGQIGVWQRFVTNWAIGPRSPSATSVKTSSPSR